MTRQRLRRWTRIALLAALPALVLAMYRYAIWNPPHRTVIGISDDGNRVLYSESHYTTVWLDPAWEQVEHYLVVQDGQRETRQPIPVGIGNATLSTDQSRVAFGDSDGGVAIYDANSLRPLRSGKVIPDGLIMSFLAFSRNGRYLAITGYDPDHVKPSCFCIVDVETLDVTLELPPDELLGAAGGPPHRLVHRRITGNPADPFTRGQIVEFETGQLQPVAPARKVLRMAYSASLRFALDSSRSPLFLLWDRERNTSRTLTIPNSYYPLFSPAEDRLLVLSVDNIVSVVDLESAKVVQTWKLRGDRSNAVFSPNGRWVAIAAARGEIEIWDADNGTRRYIISEIGRSRMLWAMGVLGACLWCVGWWMLGWQDRRTRRVVRDLTIVSAITEIGFFLRLILGGDPGHGSQPAAIGAITVLIGFSALVIVWLTFGKGRWSLRISASLAALAAIWAGPLWTWQHYQFPENFIPIGAAGVAVAVLLVMSLLRWRGYAMRMETDPVAAGKRVQLPLRDLLILPAAVGVVILVAKLAAIPQTAPWWWLASHLLVVATQAAIVSLAVWAALSERRAVIRLPAGFIGMALLSVTASIVSPTIALWWYAVIQSAIGVYVFLGLSLIRRCGWRLKRHRERRPALADN